MDEFDNAAYNMAAVTATVALYRALVKGPHATRKSEANPARHSDIPVN